MTFLRLNGWRIPVAVASASKSFTYNGELGMAWSNRPKRNRRSIERSFDFSTIKLEHFCADTLEGLLEGRGHTFPFIENDSFAFSRSGLGFEAGSSFTYNNSGGPVATRGYYLTVGGAGLLYAAELIDEPQAPTGGRWTVFWWFLNSGEWERRALRSDDAKFVNGETSGATFSEIFVLGGSVEFLSGADIADVVILPFYACNEFAEHEYDWVSGLNMTFYATMNDTLADIVSNIASDASAGLTFESGQVGRSLEFDAGADELDLGTPDELSIFDAEADGADGITIEAWVRPTGSMPVSGGRIFDRFGVGGYQFDLDGSSPYDLRMEVDYATVDASAEASSSVTADAWSHLAVTHNFSTNRSLLYVNGVAVGLSTDTSGTGALVDDTAVTAVIGNVSAGSQNMEGRIDDVKFFRRVLTLAQVKEHFLTGAKGHQTPTPTFSSRLPFLDMFGDMDGCVRRLEVSPSGGSQGYRQHGLATPDGGWRNNARIIQATLDEVCREQNERIATPDYGWAMQCRYSDNAILTGANQQPIHGQFIADPSSFIDEQKCRPGPFNWPDTAYDFDGTNAFALPDADLPRSFYGRPASTVLAWVLHDAASSDIVFRIESDTASGASRLSLDVQSGGGVRIGGRSEVGDSFQVGTGSTTLPLNEWHLIGGVLDLEDAEVRMFFDGSPDGTTGSLSFGATRFANEGGTAGRIAESLSGTAQWSGSIAGVYVWRRALSAGEIHKVYELGKRGKFT